MNWCFFLFFSLMLIRSLFLTIWASALWHSEQCFYKVLYHTFLFGLWVQYCVIGHCVNKLSQTTFPDCVLNYSTSSLFFFFFLMLQSFCIVLLFLTQMTPWFVFFLCVTLTAVARYHPSLGVVIWKITVKYQRRPWVSAAVERAQVRDNHHELITWCDFIHSGWLITFLLYDWI